MPEWLVERGIGEARFALIEDGEILAARIEPDDLLAAGTIMPARFRSLRPRPLALLDDGREVLLTTPPPKGVTEGGRFDLEITRPALPGPEPWKRALGRPAREGERAVAPMAARDLPFPPAGNDPLGAAGWDDLLAQASEGRMLFAGGELLIALTPAMTVIDVDGWLPADQLAVAGAGAAGAAIRRLDLQGSIGIDLPSTGKDARHAAVAALDVALDGEAFERTAVNGFGFVQVVRPRRRPSLIELAHDASAFAARALLRRAASGHGAARLAVHPRVAAVLEQRADWLEALGRQRGGAIALRADPRLAMSGGHVEAF